MIFPSLSHTLPPLLLVMSLGGALACQGSSQAHDQGHDQENRDLKVTATSEPGREGSPGVTPGEPSLPGSDVELPNPGSKTPGSDMCRPPEQTYWQLNPRQLVNTVEALWPGAPKDKLHQFERQMGLYAVEAEPFSSTTALSLATTSYAKEVIATMAWAAQGILSAQPAVEGIPPCVNASPDRACALTLVQQFGARAWRRPLTLQEQESMADFYGVQSAQFGPKDAMVLLVRRLLGHPEVLLRKGAGIQQPGEMFAQLDAFDRADFIAYTLTDSPPDQALFDAAKDRSLLDPAVARAHVTRLLETPPSEESLVARTSSESQRAVGLMRFFREWLDVDEIRYQKRPKLNGHQGLNEERALRWLDNEANTFVRHVLWEGDGTLKTLLSADYTMFNGSRSLARYYMGEGAGDNPPESVAPSTDGRLGMLMQGGFLTSHHSATTRGLFIRTRLLCQPVEAPVNDQIDMNLEGLKEMLESEGKDLSARQVRAVHLEAPECAGCHTVIDPLGFPFDHFDTQGLWRETWDGFPIDTKGEIVNTKQSNTQVDGPESLVMALSESPDVRRCFVKQLYTWVHGREPGPQDQCYLRAHEQRFEASGGDVRALFTDLLTSPETITRSPVWASEDTTGGAP